jgi:hypothetical protein
MGFELVYPLMGPMPILPETASITCKTLRLNASDVSRLPGGEGHCPALAILVDASTRRIAIRRPRGGEPSTKTYAKNLSSVRLNIACALAKLGKDVSEFRGKYPAVHKDDLLVIDLTQRIGGAAAPVGRHINRNPVRR